MARRLCGHNQIGQNHIGHKRYRPQNIRRVYWASSWRYVSVSHSPYGEFERERLCFTCNELLIRRSWTEIIYKDAALCVNCRMSRSALLLRLTGVGRIVLLSVKNKGNRWLLKLKLRYWYILTSKRFEICRQLLSSLTLCLCEPGVNTTFRVLDFLT